MRYVIFVGVFVWLFATFYVLVFTGWPTGWFQDLAFVICIGGIVLGLLGAIVAIVAGVWSGHQEKKQWS